MEAGSSRRIEYECKPFVVKDLHVDFMLSLRDLVRIQAIIYPAEQKMLIPLKNRDPLFVKLVSPPDKAQGVSTICDEVIPAHSETIIPVLVPDQPIGRSVHINPHPLQLDSDKPSLLGAGIVDNVRPGRLCHMRIWNVSEKPMRIRKGTKVGTATPLSLPPGITSSISANVTQTVASVSNSTQFQSRQQKRLIPKSFEQITTRKALRDRIWTDLNFHQENFGLSHDEKKEIVKIMAEHRDALSLDFNEVGRVKGVEIGIDTGDAQPIRARCRPLAPHLKEALKEQIDRWLSQKIIKPTDGPWASPIVAVPKKNGGVRFCADYRALNAITRRDSRPVANMEEKLAQIKGDPDKPTKYFGSIDLSEAYHSVPIKEEDQEKTSLITPLGLYKFQRMSFGLSAAPAAFHAVVQMIEKEMDSLDPEVGQRILLYFDDALITASDFDDLKRRLKVFLTAVQNTGMKIQVRKCNFGLRTIKWLGHHITEAGLMPDQDRVKALTEWPSPKNVEQVAKIHGLMGTFRKFIRGFSHRTQHIRKLLKRSPGGSGKDPIDWTEQCEQEKQDIIQTLTSAPLLGHPNFQKDAAPFLVTVDTSRHGIGAILSQRQVITRENGNKEEQEVVIFYGSRRLTEGESRYSAYKLELTGLVTAVESFRFYLLGRKFQIRTDHKALEWLMRTTDAKTPALCFRWQSLLSEYDFEITYIPGSKMKMVDSLSRRPYKEGDQGNLIPLLPKRDRLWDDDIDVKEARTNQTDDFWIDVMKRRFGTGNVEQPTTSVVGMISTRRVNYEESLQFKKLTKHAVIPKKGTNEAAGYDLAAAKEVIIPARSSGQIPTDLAITVPKGTYGRIASRSGLSSKHQIEVGAGVIDRDYTGNVTILLYNHGDEPFQVSKGKNIAQLICEKITAPDLIEVPELDETSRGAQGFGSTDNDGQEPVLSTGGADLTDVSNTENPTQVLPTIEDLDQEIKSILKRFDVTEESRQDLNDLLVEGNLDLEDWLKARQDKDEAIRVLMEVMDKERIRECADISLGDRTIEMDLRRINEWEHNTPGKQLTTRIQEQKKNYKVFFNLYTQGHLPHSTRALRLNGKGPLIVPLDDRQVFIQAVHHAPGTFHRGIKTTQTIAKKFFYFPGMNQKIADYIRTCDQCLRGKRLVQREGPGLGQTSSIPKTRLTVWSMDVIAMPPGKNGMKFIVTFLDVASSWLEAFPIRRATAPTIVKLLENEILPRYGEGLTFTTDQGKEMTAKVVKDAIEQYGGRCYPTTAYHSNSQPVERFHLILEQLIRAKLIDAGWPKENWPQCLPEALYTMRCSPDTQTKESPYLRVFGRNPTTRVNVWFGQQEEDLDQVDQELRPWQPDESDNEEGPAILEEDEHEVTIQQNTPDGQKVTRKYTKISPENNSDMTHLALVNQVQDEAQDRKDRATKKRHHENERQYEKKRPTFYSPVEGELVDWHRPFDEDSQFSRKLAIRWKGPYRVMSKPNHAFTVDISAVNPTTLDLVDERSRRVYVGDTRPSSIIRLRERPRNNWKPPWQQGSTADDDAQ